jgi:cobalt-precorrin 5A hydrolase/precorrin-3B C17-methyltransferase
VLWVGIGCERGTSKALIARAVQQVCQAHHLAEAAIAGVATIDVKADEVGLVGFCQERHFPLRCFPAELLRTVAVPHPSAIVQAEVGTPSVAEAAAILASREAGIEQQQKESASQKTELLVSKQIVRVPEQPGAVTIAIAVAEREYIGQSGQLWLVGTGPGQVQQITPAAQNAITQADAVIGYSLYIDLIHPLLRPGQIVEPFPITQERQRAERAIELAMWGLTVAVISSGDCGIYGMAGLVLEQLQAQGWDGQVPAVQVFPGITAVQSAAALVGAPLMHDLCTISLSDLLTPWSVIETRLMAAAEADFVTALYNPRSRSRTEHIAIAQRIFLHYRHPDTPVAIVRSAYRPEQQVTVSTLAQLLTVEIDMLTTVLIGNRSTCTYANWMITPRGYTLTDHKLGL